jgi:hypothetical protein
MALNRGWVLLPVISIPVSVVTKVVLISILNVSTVSGVLWMGILDPLPSLVAFVGLTLWHVRLRPIR